MTNFEELEKHLYDNDVYKREWIGEPVTITMDDKSVVDSTIRGPFRDICGIWCGFFEGFGGAYDLARVKYVGDNKELADTIDELIEKSE